MTSTKDNLSNVVYLGRIPEGFVEKDMKSYFAQFGFVARLKLFRNPKTGRSKGFAFIEFANAEVAKIVASTMNNYLMFEHILKCHVVPKEKVHRNMFVGWNALPNPKERMRRIVKKVNGPKNDDQHQAMLNRLAKRITQQNRKLAKFGIDYSFPVTWVDKVPEVEIKEELSDVDEHSLNNETSVNESRNILSEYSMLVDSSDDEIIFNTPDHGVRRSKKQSRNITRVSPRKMVKIEDDAGLNNNLMTAKN